MDTASQISAPEWPTPARAVDVLLGTAVTLTMAVVITVNHGGRSDPDALAYLWAVGLGALMLVRRRHPVLVLAISVAGLFAYYAAGYPAVGVAVPVAAALFSAAEFGRMRWAACAAVVALTTSVFFRITEGQEPSLVIGYEFAGHVAVMAGAIALGDSIRSRRRLLASAREVVALTHERTRRQSEVDAQAERIATARDLHDSIGHSTSVVSLHADVAREALERGDDETASEALELIKSTTAETMLELRRTVAVLRSPGHHRREVPGLSDIGDVIDIGSDVDFTTDIRFTGTLPAAVDTAAYRIIQEAVTNIVRHSAATRAHISVRCGRDRLHLTVTDNGGPTRPHAPRGAGHGIEGMRERAGALGGSLDAGPRDDGFAVRASIPLEVAS